jgi:hypothetical protein
VENKRFSSLFIAIERKIDEFGTAEARMIEEHPGSTVRKKGKVFVPEKTARRVDAGAPSTPAIMDRQAAVTEWQTVERKKPRTYGPRFRGSRVR